MFLGTAEYYWAWGQLAAISIALIAESVPLHTDARRSMKVLVVDDERTVADSTVLVFTAHGHSAKAAYSGADALRLVREFQPDLLLADVKMTGMTGIDLAIQTCGEMPGCKILLISGQAETADMLDDARLRGYQFEIVAKPVSPPLLIAKALEMTKR
jgi:CheY-like chemotaxis protein